jgi:hypothetical protein
LDTGDIFEDTTCDFKCNIIEAISDPAYHSEPYDPNDGYIKVSKKEEVEY